MATEFVVLDDSEANSARELPAHGGGNGLYSPLTTALLDGETVFVPKIAKGWNTRTFERHGKKLVTRRGERKGKEGTFLWLTEATN